MKKIVSGVALAVLLWLASLPLAAAATQDVAMACCRVHGAHRCAETSTTGAEHAVFAACPYHARAVMVSTAVARLEGSGSSIQITSSVFAQPRQNVTTQSIASEPTGRAPPLHSA